MHLVSLYAYMYDKALGTHMTSTLKTLFGYGYEKDKNCYQWGFWCNVVGYFSFNGIDESFATMCINGFLEMKMMNPLHERMLMNLTIE